MGAEPADQFPSYAELTQTQAWAGGAPVPIAPVPVAPLSAEAEAEATTARRYTERAVIGVGGMGKVVLARDARIGREVAMKQLRADRDLTPEERSRFLREAQVQGQLEHPAIVPVYDIDRRPDGTTFFTMRRVLGRTLQAILDDLRNGAPEAVARYTQRELLQAFATVCLAVDYAHSRGVIHRDLKPANIMLGNFGEVYVLDWGIARLLESSAAGNPTERLSMPGISLGTPLYMAPEQWFDPNVDGAADVFSLGAVLFEILTLQRLRTSREVMAPVDARASVRAPDRRVALELEILCVRATQHLPEDRFLSARALQEALARYLEGDRELEQRRELAASHAARARDALRRAAEPNADHERESGIAIRELGRALALEPANAEHVAMFAEIMAAAPRETPPEIRERMDAQHQEVIRSGTRYAALAALSWFLFVPLILALGLRRVDLMLLIGAPLITAVVLCFAALRHRPIRRPIQCAVLVSMLLASLAVSRMFGPLILMPTMVAMWAIVMQTHSDPVMRRFSLIAGMVSLLAPLGLELAGVLPSSYLFEDGRMIVLPQMNELPRLMTFGFLAAANLAVAIVAAIFVARLRAELTRTQERELVQAWQFRRLPLELIRAGGR
jgi:serine/threonine-protein kinase